MKATKIIVGYATFILGFSSLLTIIFPEFFSSMFTKDPELLALMGKTLPVYMGGMVIFGIQNGGQVVFLGIGLAKTSIFLALFRKILLLIPLALILPNYMGVMGVFYAELISDTLSAITTLFIFMFIFKKVVDKNMQ